MGTTQAYLEIRVVLAKLVYAYDMELEAEAEADWIRNSRMHFLWKKAPLRVRFIPRGEIV